MNGTPPCNAQFQDLFQIGFKNDGTSPNRRRARFSGEIFREGILEAIIELGRKQLEVTLQENGGIELQEASSHMSTSFSFATPVMSPLRDSQCPKARRANTSS
jgi:hypothetical protein